MSYVVPIDQARQLAPEYTFVKSLSASSHKSAFEVFDSHGNHLCLKFISPDFDLDRLTREITAMQSLDHPNIAKLVMYLYSPRLVNPLHYTVEQFIEGHDLKNCLKDEPWELSKTANFFAQLCDGLAELAKNELVHRDLKPENIRVRPDFTPVIIDFGLVRHLSLTDLTTTGMGARIGTPLYFSPEQISGTKHDIEYRTDLYALGTIMYEALVGHHPFINELQTGGFEALMDAICTSYAFKNDKTFKLLPPKWQALVTKLLEKDKDQRPANAELVATILRKL